MKYLVIGLGNFGMTLAKELTDIGHDVIGVDSNVHRVEEIKDRISVAYIFDATERVALQALPLDEIDCAVVAIGQSMDYSLRTVAALKELSVKRIYARALDKTHKSILKAMNIQRIFIPESYAARVFAEKFADNDFEDMM
ncbi:MAG: TrkA family potassium uptake protein [Alistipes sp.]|nr:TrkA family potassium uptake protein [Alistipes sp.]MBR6760269.1 TrkA family potassium uptake protein [Alistipes sp.]